MSDTITTWRRFERSSHAPVNGENSSTGASITFASRIRSPEDLASWKCPVCAASMPSSAR